MQENINLERRSTPTLCEAKEKPGYLSVSGEQLYYVLHPAADKPLANILFLGPFVSERPHRYIPIVRMARYMAQNGYNFLRFDYRGCGESTGLFENYAFNAWREDATECYNFLKKQSRDLPTIIYGLGMGGLLGTQIFREGKGDALFLCLPPDSGQAMLYDQLKIKLANDFVLKPPDRKSREGYIQDLDNGETIEVEGYSWTGRLWNEAAGFTLSDNTKMKGSEQSSSRPSMEYELDSRSAHMFGGVGPNPIRPLNGGVRMRLVNPDLTMMYSEVLSIFQEWLISIGT